MEHPEEPPVCSDSAPFGDLHGLSRSMEREFLSVLSYPRFLLSSLLFYHVVFFY